MRFQEIKKESKVFPGEYLLHLPTNQIVLVGAFNFDEDFIRCLNNGRLMTDAVKNFKKIQMSQKELNQNRTRCKGCGRTR
tara:strand:+ start:1585 stop:1824 length:240 start_codon:yes stop_codon:yes gene_type:complete